MIVNCKKCKKSFDSVYGVCPACGTRYIPTKKKNWVNLIVFISAAILVISSVLMVLRVYDFNIEEKHMFGEWQGSTATCVGDGIETRTCKVCGDSEERIALATGEHIFGEWSSSDETCSKSGTSKRVCIICGLEETMEIPATQEHIFSEDSPKCANCDEPNPDYKNEED